MQYYICVTYAPMNKESGSAGRLVGSGAVTCGHPHFHALSALFYYRRLLAAFYN